MDKMNYKENLIKEIDRLDKKIHELCPSRCPKCKVKLKSYVAIENHIKKYKHHGNYNATSINPSETGYPFKEWENKKAELKGYETAQKEFSEWLDNIYNKSLNTKYFSKSHNTNRLMTINQILKMFRDKIKELKGEK